MRGRRPSVGRQYRDGILAHLRLSENVHRRRHRLQRGKIKLSQEVAEFAGLKITMTPRTYCQRCEEVSNPKKYHQWQIAAFKNEIVKLVQLINTV